VSICHAHNRHHAQQAQKLLEFKYAPERSTLSSPSTPSVHESENDQKQHGTDGGVDDGGDDAGAKVNSELRQQPAADEGADDPNDDIRDDSEAGALYDLSRKPSSDKANQQNDEETFTRHMHIGFLFLSAGCVSSAGPSLKYRLRPRIRSAPVRQASSFNAFSNHFDASSFKPDHTPQLPH
jgi:hypothetical protein